MAVIDIKNAIMKAFDGTLGTTTVDCTNANADMTFTAKSKHIGTDKISITFTDPSASSQALAITVDGREIDVSLATDGGGVITSTGALIKAAIEADSDANALVTVTYPVGHDGSGIVEAKAKQTLDGQKSVTVKLGEGNFSYSEHKDRIFVLDRGVLDTVKDDDQAPMDISMDSTWEWIRAQSGEPPTLEDVLKNRYEAAAWLTTADDSCQPYCVDLELYNSPPACGVTDDEEILMFEEYYYETVDHDLREGTLSTSGRCNRVEATARRAAKADIIDS